MSCLNSTVQFAAVVTNPNILLLVADILPLFRDPSSALGTEMEFGVLGFRLPVIDINTQLGLASHCGKRLQFF